MKWILLWMTSKTAEIPSREIQSVHTFIATIAPRSAIPYGGTVRCLTCGKWISGHYGSINQHGRWHRENGEEMIGHSLFFEPSMFTDN
jgi:hypothetical protein